MTPSRQPPRVKIPPTPDGARPRYAPSAAATTGQCPLNHEQLAFISLMQLLRTSLNSLGGPFDLMAKLAAMGPALEASKQVALRGPSDFQLFLIGAFIPRLPRSKPSWKPTVTVKMTD
jgi:hypothetical protein